MHNINNWVADGSYRPGKWNGMVKLHLQYWWIKFNNVKLYKTWLFFLWKWLETVYNSGSVSRHCLTLIVFAISTIIFSRCLLLTSPNWLFSRLISLHLVLFQKFGLWSLMVIKAGQLSVTFHRFTKIKQFSYFLVSLSILCLTLLLNFL